MATKTPSWMRNQPGMVPPSSYVTPGSYPTVAPSSMPTAWPGVQAPAATENLLASLSMRKNMQQGFPPQTALGGTLAQAAGLGGSGWQPGRAEGAPPQVKSWVPNVPTPTPTGAPGFDWSVPDLLSKTTGALPSGLGLTVPKLEEPMLGAFAAPAAAPVQAAPVPPPKKCREGCVMRLNSSSSSRQHPSKQAQGIPNADATEESPRLLGICDGVSGCTKLGISPENLPRELLVACRNKSRPWFDKVGSQRDSDGKWLCKLMEEAYSSTRALGATTMLLGSILDNGLLVTANVGDCALLVLRVLPADRSPRTQVVFKTQATRYEATKPVQVQRLPNIPDSRTFHTLQNAKCDSCMLQPSDYLVLGSDGLFDNLQDREIQEIIERHCPMGGVAQSKALAEAARALVDAAITHATQALPANGMKPGDHCNPDDTTALVASAVEVPNAEEFDRWFWRQRGIQQPYQDGQRPNTARVPSNNSVPGVPRMQTGPQGKASQMRTTSQTRAKSLEPPPMGDRTLQDCTNTAGGDYDKRLQTTSQSNNLGTAQGKGKGGGKNAAPDWWTKMQVPGKQAAPPEQRYGARSNLAAAQTLSNMPEGGQVLEDGVEIAQPRLTSTILRAHEVKMAIAPTTQYYPNVPQTSLAAPGQKPGGWGVPSMVPPRQNTMQSNEQCVIS